MKRMEVTVGDLKRSKRAVKYLVVIIGNRLNFKEHVKYIGENESVTQAAMTGMMQNIGRPNPFNRRMAEGTLRGNYE